MNSNSPSKMTNRVVAAVPAFILLAAVLFPAPKPANAIPAFARKYGLPCSACHITWPELNNFGQVFRDNGYQMMNERDSPITRDPSYFPMTVRITPQWHRESAMATSGGRRWSGQRRRRHGIAVGIRERWTTADSISLVLTCGLVEPFTRTFRSAWLPGCLRRLIPLRSTLKMPSCDSTISFTRRG